MLNVLTDVTLVCRTHGVSKPFFSNKSFCGLTVWMKSRETFFPFALLGCCPAFLHTANCNLIYTTFSFLKSNSYEITISFSISNSVFPYNFTSLFFCNNRVIWNVLFFFQKSCLFNFFLGLWCNSNVLQVVIKWRPKTVTTEFILYNVNKSFLFSG